MDNIKQSLKKISDWLAGIFKVEEVWTEKDHGQWVKRKRYHPIIKAFALVCAAALCVAAWRLFSTSGAGVEREIIEPEIVKPETAEREIAEQETPPAIEASADVTSPDFRDFGETREVLSSDAEPAPDTPEISETSGTPTSAGPGPLPDGLRVADGEYWIRVDKSEYKLYLYRGAEVDRTYDVAVGRNPGDKERPGDNKTPNGIFTVQSIENSRTWTHDFRDGKGNIRGAYGPWFIRLRTGWRGIGIHGTHDPNSLGSMVSEGCVRMHNNELEELKQFAKVRMKVVIEE